MRGITWGSSKTLLTWAFDGLILISAGLNDGADEGRNLELRFKAEAFEALKRQIGEVQVRNTVVRRKIDNCALER